MNNYPPHTLDFVIILGVILVILFVYCIYLYRVLKNHKESIYILKDTINDSISIINRIDKEYDRQIENLKSKIQILADYTDCKTAKEVKYKTLKDYKK